MERQWPTRFRNKDSALRKAAARTHAFPLSLNAILETPPPLRVNNLISLPREIEVGHRLWKVGAASALYHECESLCFMMLAIVGIGIVLYSAGMFRDITDQERFLPRPVVRLAPDSAPASARAYDLGSPDEGRPSPPGAT